MLLYRPPRKHQKPKKEKPVVDKVIMSFRNEEEYEAAAARAMTPKAKKVRLEEEKKEPLQKRPGLPSVFNNRDLAEQRIQERKEQ